MIVLATSLSLLSLLTLQLEVFCCLLLSSISRRRTHKGARAHTHTRTQIPTRKQVAAQNNHLVYARLFVSFFPLHLISSHLTYIIIPVFCSRKSLPLLLLLLSSSFRPADKNSALLCSVRPLEMMRGSPVVRDNRESESETERRLKAIRLNSRLSIVVSSSSSSSNESGDNRRSVVEHPLDQSN